MLTSCWECERDRKRKGEIECFHFSFKQTTHSVSWLEDSSSSSRQHQQQKLWKVKSVIFLLTCWLWEEPGSMQWQQNTGVLLVYGFHIVLWIICRQDNRIRAYDSLVTALDSINLALWFVVFKKKNLFPLFA